MHCLFKMENSGFIIYFIKKYSFPFPLHYSLDRWSEICLEEAFTFFEIFLKYSYIIYFILTEPEWISHVKVTTWEKLQWKQVYPTTVTGNSLDKNGFRITLLSSQTFLLMVCSAASEIISPQDGCILMKFELPIFHVAISIYNKNWVDGNWLYLYCYTVE